MEISLARIAEIVEGEIKGDFNKTIGGGAPFDDAAPNDITFADNARLLKRINETKAGAVIVPLDFQSSSKNIILVDHPRVAFAKVLKLFHQPSQPDAGISSNAHIGNSFVCGKDITIGHFAVIGNNVTIGDRVILYPNVVIGDKVVIGNDVEIYPNVTVLERCRIGSRVTIQAGTVIGSDGFGFASDGKKYYKIPQTGIVQIDDDVEIGAGNTVDRATFGKTWIGQGVKTDNLVHIAHNVKIGENTVIVAQVGISGSTTIGRHTIIAGQAGIRDHLTIGDRVTIGPQAGISKSIPKGEVVSGSPELPHRLWLKVQRIIPRLPELKRKISEIEKKLIEIERKQNKVD